MNNASSIEQAAIKYFENKRKRAHPCDAQYYDTAIAALSSVKDSPAKNNADKIRSMTDEELAELLERCEGEGYQDSSITPIMENGYHVDMLEWLKQPAEEE